ncbi:Fur-regulated basic protein FbpA [Mangrovibacillus cuniculi]|uniref:Fur-regulated basic protein FbpA n=1 Tax=Mangrovibacillus cuniculi TaxID=2593652 RepID=A0A7S8CBX1_9BACI|nr:Fur-regulated basic protein FbpA [Mangrovibacillus cuniculi]QPC47130.1 Fur-regulated basic protein FbpA [Mangrovibacillus cuniculi]QPC48517.1 Fur-regulated basic protein FbpA [Mangrovibacillus cuniculi]
MQRVDESQNKQDVRRSYLTDWLIKHQFIKHPDGRQLFELSLVELEQNYIHLRCQKGKQLAIRQSEDRFKFVAVN